VKQVHPYTTATQFPTVSTDQSTLQPELHTTECYFNISTSLPLMLLAGQQEGHLACKKTEWLGAGVVICLERGADLHMAQLMPLPLTVSCFSKIQIHFTFLIWAQPGST